MRKPAVLVIGAGIGGIAAAARLARQGYPVTVIEKNEVPGGRCGMMEIEGHRFDTGPTLFLMPELYIQSFRELGENIEDHLDLQRVDPTYQIHYADGLNLTLTSDLKSMRDQLAAIEPGGYEGFLRYLEEGSRHYRLSYPSVITKDFRTPTSFFNLKNLALILKIKAHKKHYSNMSNYFEDPRLRFGFSFQDLYMGLNPYTAPAIYSLMPYSELSDGVWFPRGGMYSVINALVNIASSHGVNFEYSTLVEEIVLAGGKTAGVKLSDGSYLSADIVIANADLAYVYEQLLPPERYTNSLKRKKYGCSALVYFWGLDKKFNQIHTHNLFLAEDIREGFRVMFDELSLTDDPSFYVHAPTRVDPSMAPKGQDTLVVAVPAPHLDDENLQDWESIAKRTRKFIIQRLAEIGVSDIEKHIKFEIQFDPRDWKKRYNLTKGSAHGLGHELLQMGYMRPHNRHAKYQNLYFVGASTHPGTGLPSVLTSAKFVSDRILEEASA